MLCRSATRVGLATATSPTNPQQARGIMCMSSTTHPRQGLVAPGCLQVEPLTVQTNPQSTSPSNARQPSGPHTLRQRPARRRAGIRLQHGRGGRRTSRSQTPSTHQSSTHPTSAQCHHHGNHAIKTLPTATGPGNTPAATSTSPTTCGPHQPRQRQPGHPTSAETRATNRMRTHPDRP